MGKYFAPVLTLMRGIFQTKNRHKRDEGRLHDKGDETRTSYSRRTSLDMKLDLKVTTYRDVREYRESYLNRLKNMGFGGSRSKGCGTLPFTRHPIKIDWLLGSELGAPSAALV